MTVCLYTESAASATQASFTASYFAEVLTSLRSVATHNAVFCCVVARKLFGATCCTNNPENADRKLIRNVRICTTS